MSIMQRSYQHCETARYAEGIGRVIRGPGMAVSKGETMRKAMSIGLAVILVVSVTGCASAANKVTEKVAEKAIENASGGNANVDISNNGGTIQVQTDQGSATYGGGDIPDSIDVSFPSGYEVIASSDTPTDASVQLDYADRTFDDIVASLQSWVDGQPGDFNATTSSGNGVQIQAWSSDALTIAVQNCLSNSGGQDICVYVEQSKS